MKKETIADKMAKKAFHSPEFQKSWAVHMQAFGPILEPAFAQDYQSRVHLAAALNHISKRQFSPGLSKLKMLQNACVNDADKAALLFFFGVFHEMAGKREESIIFYSHANEYHHRLHIPYLKVAKFYQEGCLYDRAEANYRSAIACFNATGLDEQSKIILGSAYTNLATCLTYMHRYDEAEAALATSRSIYPNAPVRAMTEAVLYAALGQAEKVKACLAIMEKHTPQVLSMIQEKTRKILAGTDPLFCEIPLDEEKVAEFWNWFLAQDAWMRSRLDSGDRDAVLQALVTRLTPIFPFADAEPQLEILTAENGAELEFRDFYALALNHGYDVLLQACPEALEEYWAFDIVN